MAGDFLSGSGYFFRPRITNTAPESNAIAVVAALALISGTADANARLDIPTNKRAIPATRIMFFPLLVTSRVVSGHRMTYCEVSNKPN